MSTYVQPVGLTGDYLANLRAARSSTGAGQGTGETFLKIDDRTGQMTYGQERVPLQDGHRFVVGLHGFRHGYIDMQGGQVVDRNVIPMVTGARPTPPGGKYGTYEGGGPRDVTECEMSSIDEPGFRLVFTAWGISSANRIGNLLEIAVVHAEGPEGRSGYVHPVIVPKAGKYYSKKYSRDVWHFDFELVDWLHNDGETLLSDTGGKLEAQASNGGEAPPFDDDMTDAERDLLG